MTTNGEDSTVGGPSAEQLAHFAPFVQRLQRDPQFLALIEEFTEGRRGQPTREAQADFVQRLQQEPHFLALIEEFTGGPPDQRREAQTSPPGTTGWPTEEAVIAGPKAAAAAVAAAALVAGG